MRWPRPAPGTPHCGQGSGAAFDAIAICPQLLAGQLGWRRCVDGVRIGARRRATRPPDEHRARGPARRRCRAEDMKELLAELERTLVHGDGGATRAAVERLLAQADDDAFADELVPALMRRLDHDRLADAITIAEIWLAARRLEAALLELAQLHLTPAADAPLAVLATPIDEQHHVGLSLLELRLRSAGWRVMNLAGYTPGNDLHRLARERGAKVVALSISQPDLAATLRWTLDALQPLRPATRIWLGGRASGELGSTELVDWVADGLTGVAQRLFELAGEPEPI
jgi:methanogenic corrinoid protein MtbC1